MVFLLEQPNIGQYINMKTSKEFMLTIINPLNMIGFNHTHIYRISFTWTYRYKKTFMYPAIIH